MELEGKVQQHDGRFPGYQYPSNHSMIPRSEIQGLSKRFVIDAGRQRTLYAVCVI